MRTLSQLFSAELSAPAHGLRIYWRMSRRLNLEHIMRVPQELPQTPAAQALALKLVTDMDLLRLKAVARLYARGLPPEVGWADLLQDAFTRVLDGSRKCPEGLPMAAFLAGVMRSIRAEHCRRARKTAARLPQMLAQFELRDDPESEAGDPTPDPERSLIAMQLLSEIQRLFADDLQAQQVIEGLFEGLSPDQICARYGMSKTGYDSTRRRMRRALLREGLRWGGHDN
jgi:DNA-directed RNA polymerase specialized sigma24 family protein